MITPLVNFCDDFVRLIDPDEETFLIYTALNTVKNDDNPLRGLGSLDSKQGTLTLELEVTANPSVGSPPTSPQSNKGSSRRKEKRRESGTLQSRSLQIELRQDTTALRSRAGDTGSVLWQASVDLARLLLDQHRLFLRDNGSKTLFEYSKLAQCHVMEFGAGVGLLPIALAPLVQSYTATDLPTELPLIRKNLSLNVSSWESNKKIFVEPCDWIQLHSTPAHSRGRYHTTDQEMDLILAVDCIFNPALINPLVSTLTHYAIPQKTVVMVMIELRSHEVVEEFVKAWLQSANWEIQRVGGGLLHPRYALWLGFKQE